MKSILAIAIALSLTLLGAPQAMAQTGHDLFQQALVKERSDGDLRGAIAIYERIAEEFATDRALTAKALVQMGQCYEKLGSTEAERAYRRVVREFADQDDLVVRAQSRLAALQRAALAAETPSITTRRVSAGLNVGAHDPTPDGKYLVWGDFQGTMNLAVREVATGESRYLTQDSRYTPTWAVAYGGRVSPDGKWVAHGYSEQDQGGSLRVVGMDGENLRTLLREKGCWVQPYEWTSDGESIAARWDCWSEANPEGTHKMVLVSAADGTVRTVHEVPSTRHAFRSWLSPDDRYLVYGGPVTEDDGNADIWVLPLDESAELPLIQHPADDQLLGWVPGTNQVLFLSDRDGTWDLWAASVSDGEIVGPPRKVRRDMGEVGAAGFSEDGSLFYSVFTRWFTTSVAPFDVVTGRANLEAATPLLGSNRNPHWSPDGEHLAFSTESELTEGKQGRLNIRHLATGEQRELATHLGVRFVGDWSPDGRAILAQASGSIHAVDVTSGEAMPLLTLPGPQRVWAEWSADGEAIIYSLMSDSAPHARIMRRELGSGEERELYRDSLSIWRPVEVSPDGRHLVFSFDDSVNAVGRGGLMALDIESGDARRIVAHGDSVNGEPGSVQWTPDGNYVLYAEIVHGDEWRTNVWRVPVDGGEPEYLWTVGEGKYGSWFELSPDGKQIALTTYTQENEIWVMEGLKEVLSRQ
jgi:Tol biopolymer transport system component